MSVRDVSERARIESGVYRADCAQARERQVVAGENEHSRSSRVGL